MRRRGHTFSQHAVGQDDSLPLHEPPNKDMDVTFTTKYIDTLSQLQRLEDENKRLMAKMRSVEAQIVPASKSSKEAYIKIIAPSCLEFHNEERKLNRTLQEENDMLRRQFQNSVNAATEANEKLTESLSKIKLLELSVAGRIDGGQTQITQESQQTQEVQKMQELQATLLKMERRWASEKKQLTIERDEYALQCESLKSAVAAMRAAHGTETTKAEESKSDETKGPAPKTNDLKAHPNDDSVSASIQERNSTDSKNSLMHRQYSVENLVDVEEILGESDTKSQYTLESARPPTATLRSQRPISRPPPSPGVGSSRAASDTKYNETKNSATRNGDALQLIPGVTNPKVERDLLVLAAKNKELQKVADQNRFLAEEAEAQNEILALEIKRLTDKLRLLTALEGRFFTRPESPPILPTVRNSSAMSPGIPLSPQATTLSSSGKLTKRSPARSEEEKNLAKSTKDRPVSAVSAVSPLKRAPSLTPWDTSASITGLKIAASKKSANKK